MKVQKKSKNSDIQRINQIYKVLKKNDFGYLIEENTFFKTFPFLRNRKINKDKELPDTTIPIRIRKVLEELGPAYIKLGQMLSTRPDLVGLEISEELQKLRDRTPITDFSEIKELIESELGHPLDEIYTDIDEIPIGSASIGQVHTARLKENGEKVAIKVQKPNTEETIKSDLRIMKFLAVRSDRYLNKTKVYNLPAIILEFEKSILKEINFLEEVRNMEVLASNFKTIPYIHIPEPYIQYCSGKVITMEFIDGKQLSEVIEDNTDKYNKKLIAKRGMDSYFKQVMVDGFFHADPHPGNIIVLDKNKICYVDMGMMGILDDTFKENLAELILLLINGNTDNIINQLIYMDIITPSQNTPELKADINDLMKKYYGTKLKNVNGSIEDLLDAMVKNNVILPREFVMIARGLALIEESGKKLNPNFDTAEELKGLSKKIILHKASPKRLFKLGSNYILEIGHLAKNLPNTVNNTLSKLEDGEITIKLKHEGIMELSKQVTTAIVMAALIVGSSLALFADKGPTILNIPVLGLIGYVISFALGIYLVIQYIMFDLD
ncbi:AarF/ABC1/UbiB kinase family protein [uncultured Methanobrevibacter sp.]|uniref:ABC1 kinase family protein n=1 Tax=uncultured Methanobrevibacter sp. TaxID=253161 RepID=UPI0025EB31CC|nr:AarF/ABC1/UbiB kinase family protein [uncultured Methanobrevibacter sp.]